MVIEDWMVYAGYAGILGVLIGWVLARARSAPGGSAEEKPAVEEKEQRREHEQVSLDNVLGIDKALAAKFYRNLRKAIASGEVRVALVSDKCPDGYVAYDFVREDWICVERDGSSYPLGGRPAGEHLEVEDGLKGVADSGG